MKNKLVVGQIVSFKFGKQPASSEDMKLSMRRSKNISEMKQFKKDESSIKWVDLYATDKIVSLNSTHVLLESGYRFKISDVSVVQDVE